MKQAVMYWGHKLHLIIHKDMDKLNILTECCFKCLRILLTKDKLERMATIQEVLKVTQSEDWTKLFFSLLVRDLMVLNQRGQKVCDLGGYGLL